MRYDDAVLKLKKTRPTRQESRARTRERLLLSAREVFARNGYAGASVDLIAENTGFSKGAFYSNFDSKEALFLELLEQHKADEIKALEGLLTSTESIEHLVEQVGAHYRRVETDLDWGLLSAEFQIQASRDPEFAKHVVKLYRGQRAALGLLIERLFAKASRNLPAPADELAAIFMGMSVGLSLERISDKSGIRKGLLGDAILLVLNSILTGKA
jgi:TetR/AcrR family transcriptional regulator, transcriptional repressor of aconitase